MIISDVELSIAIEEAVDSGLVLADEKGKKGRQGWQGGTEQ